MDSRRLAGYRALQHSCYSCRTVLTDRIVYISLPTSGGLHIVWLHALEVEMDEIFTDTALPPFRDAGEWGAKIQQNLAKIAKFWKKTAKNSAIFNENFEIRDRCKGVHCVDLGESFPTSIYLHNLASIEPSGGAHRPQEAPRCNFKPSAVPCQILL